MLLRMRIRNQLTSEQKLEFCQEADRAQVSFAELCRAFRITRQTGYKWWTRYQAGGDTALVARSRRPHRCPFQLRPHWIERIRRTRHRFPRWGAKKLRAWLRRDFPRARLPTVSSIGRVLRRLHLSQPRPRRPRGPVRVWPPFRTARRPNEVWTVDFKGHFRTTDGVRCEPLTVRDLYSRYGLCVSILPDRSELRVRRQFVRLFRRYGLPQTIHCDQGGPFGSAGPAHLSRLSAWWLSLGIEMEYSRRGRPADNGAHEQWHRELKAETARPPAATPAAQRRRTRRWLRHYNHERPHEALQQRVPAQRWHRSQRPYRGILQPGYPKTWLLRRVQQKGEIYWRGGVRFVSEALGGYQVALRPKRNGVWQVYFYKRLIGELHAPDNSPVRPAQYKHRSHHPQV
jgi:putative transposase